ncbi:MAG: hypothetical protein ABEI57_01415, partial [Halapricum sp.]
MAQGQDDPPDRDDGRVLAPDELDISNDEHVAEIEDGRYVVSPNDPIDDVGTVADASTGRERPSDRESPVEPDSRSDTVPESAESEPRPAPSPEPATEPSLDHEQVHEWLVEEFDDSGSRYGFDVTAKFDGPVEQRQMMSNDVVTIFESLILWYAQHIDTTTPVEEVLGILLMESNVPIQFPPESLHRLVKSSGLSPDDT